MKKAMIIGCGRWGSFICWYMNKVGLKTTLYGRETSSKFQEFKEKRTNGTVILDEKVELTSDLSKTKEQDIIVVSVNSQGFRRVLEELAPYGLQHKIFILNMKGIEISTGKRLSQVAEEFLEPSNELAVWLGPGHPLEFVNGIPNCMVIDSKDEKTKEKLIERLSSPLIRFYYGEDLIGNEIGAAYKNVIGIAAGMLDGMKLSSLKGALMSRGCREVARLIYALGGNELSAYGLCHLGDYEATVFSKLSNNRRFGESFIKKEAFDKLAEGYYTTKALRKMGKEKKVDLPINEAVYQILYEKEDPKRMLTELFSRSLKGEFYL
ncbi:MAG: NAD(P)H-dependent glycerol-3-phosphate dehydrogenase [Tissierellia bacterium]|nr:NAD(P)H-dependent glycerol-3-phosphate dehydrogenase [Tissierellia bacterium]